MSDSKTHSRLLRLALRGNAAFSTLSAVVFLVAADAIAGFLKILPAHQVMVMGVQLGLFAVWLWWLSWRPVVPRWQVWLIIALDVLWVGGSFQIVLASPPALTVGGNWAIGMVADVVALLAVMQFLGLRRLQRARLTTNS